MTSEPGAALGREPETVRWRTSARARMASVVLCVAVVAVAVGLLTGVILDSDGSSRVSTDVFAVVMILGGVLAAWLMAFRPSITLDRGAVTVVNAFRTTRIPLARVTTVSAEKYGIGIHWQRDTARGGTRPIVATAVQKAPFSQWAKRATRADAVVAAISAAAERNRE